MGSPMSLGILTMIQNYKIASSWKECQEHVLVVVDSDLIGSVMTDKHYRMQPVALISSKDVIRGITIVFKKRSRKRSGPG